jgi:hypothetical protein
VTRSRVVAPIVAILIFYLILASSLNITRRSNAQSGEWSGTIALQYDLNENLSNVFSTASGSGSGSFTFTVGSEDVISGQAQLQGTASNSDSQTNPTCQGSGTSSFTISYTLVGSAVGGIAFLAFLNSTAEEFLPSSFTESCSDGSTFSQPMGSPFAIQNQNLNLSLGTGSSAQNQFSPPTQCICSLDGYFRIALTSGSISSSSTSSSSSSSSVSTTASSVSTTAFDFTISMPVQNPGFCPPSSPTTCLVVFAGDSTESNAINLGLSAGSSAPQQVTLSVSSLPPGVSANFIPSSVIPPGSTTLKIQTSSVSTPAGNYTITVTGSGPGGTPSHSAAFVLRVDVIPYAQAESDGAAYLTHDGKTEAVTPGAGSPFALQPGDSLTTQSGYTSITFPGVHDNLIIGPGSRIDVHSESESTTEYEVSPTTGSPAYVYQSTYQKIVVFRYCDPQTGHCIYDVQATGCQTSQQGPAPRDVGACAGDPGFSLSVTNTSMLAQVYSGYVTVVDQNTNQSLVVQGGNELNATIGFTPTSPTTLNDTAAPDVTGTFPNSSNDTISASTPISVSFSKFIYPPSTAGSNFTVVGPGGTRVAGTWTAFGQTVVFTPSQPFSAGSFTVTVLGGPHGVSDLSGNVLPSDYSFAFSVASPVPPLSETEYRIIGFALIVGLVAAAALLITRIARGGGKGNKVPPPDKSQRW